MRTRIDTPPDSSWVECRGWYWATDRYILVRNDAPALPTVDGAWCRRWMHSRELGDDRAVSGMLNKIRRSRARPAPRGWHIPTAETSSAGAAAELLLPYVERLGGRCLYFRVYAVPMIAAFLPGQRLPLVVIAMARVLKPWGV